MKVLAATLALALGVLPSAVLADASRYIVKFNDGKGEGAINALHAAGASVVLSLPSVDAVAAHIPDHAVAGLEHNPNIEYIEVDAPRFPMALANRTLAGGETLPYGIAMVQADLVNTNGTEGNKKICIIDSGYSEQHTDLKNTTPTNSPVTSSVTPNAGTWNKDSCGHGSHVAGTISATAGGGGVVGVIPGVKLHIVKVFGNDDLASENCDWTYSSTLVKALEFCTGAGANIVSMSLGGGLKSRTEETAFDKAYNTNKMLHVAAAGNDGSRATSYPAGYASVISVAAVDANEVVATFSQQDRDVELAAPGVAVLSTVPWLDVDTLTFQAGGSVSGGHVEFSGRTPGTTGALFDGGQCTTTNAAWSGKVVLCQRGTNSFNEKVQLVQGAGGTAAVIYNNTTSDPTCGPFVGTLGDGNSSTVAAITLSCADGSAALSHANQSGTVLSQFNAPASGYEAWDGTSMATPHVSGVAALIWGCNPGKTNVDIRNALTSGAKDKGGNGRDNAYGFGIVQAVGSLTKLGWGGCALLGSSKYP